MREVAVFPVTPDFMDHLLAWSQDFERVSFLDSSRHPTSGLSDQFHSLVALGAKRELTAQTGNAFQQLKAFQQAEKDWLFGFLGYDLKNEVENLHSHHPDGVELPDLHFFQPEHVIRVSSNRVEVATLGTSPESVYQAVLRAAPLATAPPNPPLQLKARIPKAAYLHTIGKLKAHIRQGDIYEVNFCQEFFAANASLNPYATFQRLNRISPTPFAAFYRLDHHYLLCGSPERFLRKEGERLISQPIKGTAPRGNSSEEDEHLRHQLLHSAKDRSENVMIVDLVRNDLAQTAQPESVQVEELFGIYTFPKVHQMISTVSSRLHPNFHAVDALRHAFPMGSMTGAPKIRAMELIEQFEQSKRGLYSGAVGYFTPEGDFDFNVVIRSLLYNQAKAYLSFQVGGAIIDASDPEAEYQECLVKARPLLETLGLKDWNQQS